MPRLSQQLQPTSEDIARLAYKLWEESGKPGGRDAEFWYKAERLLRSTASPVRPASAAVQIAEAQPAVSVARVVAPSDNRPKTPGRRQRGATGAKA